MIRLFLAASAIVAVILFALSNTDLFRDPGTIEARNRLVNGKAADTEVEVAHKEQLYALDIKNRKLDLQKKQLEVTQMQQDIQAAAIRNERWTATGIQMAWAALYIVLGAGSILSLLYIGSVVYQAYIAPSLAARWAAQVRIAQARANTIGTGYAPAGNRQPATATHSAARTNERSNGRVIPFPSPQVAAS